MLDWELNVTAADLKDRGFGGGSLPPRQRFVSCEGTARAVAPSGEHDGTAGD